jgi:recombination protein RecA
MLTKEEKLKLAKQAKESIQKEIGKGAVMSLDEKPNMDIDVISTGSIGVNKALGVNGLPKGRVVEIVGHESSGKTTLAIHIISESQKKGGLCAIIDAENAFDKEYAKALGVNTEELDISQPENGEQALDITQKLIESGAYDVIVVDSVAAIVPKAEIEGEMADQRMGLHAKLMSKALRVLTPLAKKHNVLLIFINQYRQKMVLMGNPDVATGGLALRFFASVRLEVSRSTTNDNSVFGDVKDLKIGNKTTVKVLKNKVAPPFKKADFDILYGIGIDKVSELIDIANSLKIIKKWGTTVTLLDGTKHDLVEFRNLLLDNEVFYKELEQKCYDGNL